MRVAGSRDLKTFSEPLIAPTPQNFEEAVSLFKSFSQQLSDGEKIESSAGGIAAVIDPMQKKILRAPHLNAWEGKDFPCDYLQNDAAMGALGEALYGAGKGKEIVAYITIGTGVGGARVVRGKIDENSQGFEPGHHILNNGESFEELVSGTAILKKYGKEAKDITDPKIWEEMARWLAVGLYNTNLFWSPNVLILGGSMIVKETAIPFDKVSYLLSELKPIFAQFPPVEKAMLGDLAGLWGAMGYLNQA